MGNRIDLTFNRLREAGRKALIGYITAGFPTKASFQALVPLMERSGVDILEVGVPFSDPIADGPTIQAASQKALENGVTLEWILASIRHLRQRGINLPLILMSYCNPIHARGVKRFFAEAKESGVDGLIIPDLIPEEAAMFREISEKTGIDLIYLAAPTTPPARLVQIAQQTRGFLYAVSLTGVTGARADLPPGVIQFLKQARRATEKPLAVGFGLSTPQQVKDISAYVDGVIVGSALIKAIGTSHSESFKNAAEYVGMLRRALDSRSNGKDLS